MNGDLQVDNVVVREAIQLWVHRQIAASKNNPLFITVTFRNYAPISRVNQVARFICDKFTPPGLLWCFAEQGARYGRVHCHAILVPGDAHDATSLSDMFSLQSFLNVQFGRSEVSNARQEALDYVTKYATKEAYNDQWG